MTSCPFRVIASCSDGIAGHAGRVEQFIGGTITPDEFRPMRLSYGLYYQLDHTSYMQRIKIPGRSPHRRPDELPERRRRHVRTGRRAR